MSEEHHHHHLFGRHKHDEDEAPPPPPPCDEYSEDAIPYQETEYYDGPRRPSGGYSTVETTDVYVKTSADDAEARAKKEEKEHQRKEHFGETVGAAAGAFAMYERHEEKKDAEHAGRHKTEERIAEAVAVGAGGFALHERHEKKEAVKEENDDREMAAQHRCHEFDI